MADNSDDDNVMRLPVRFKDPLPPDRTLIMPHEAPKPMACNHLFVQYIVDESAAEVTCGECGIKLNAMWVLSRLAREDRRYAEAAKRYQDEMARLRERSRTKCMNCGQMTPISRR